MFSIQDSNVMCSDGIPNKTGGNTPQYWTYSTVLIASLHSTDDIPLQYLTSYTVLMVFLHSTDGIPNNTGGNPPQY